METNRIRQFCTIAQTENLRKAADLLGISHGGLFKSLKVLEEELNISLFNREGRGIVLSDAGREFYPKALKFLTAHEELISNTSKFNEVKIGTFEVFSTYFFTSFIVPELKDSFISLKELVPGELEQALIENEIDFGITYEPIPTQGIDILKIAKCKMGIFGNKKYTNSITTAPFAAPVKPINSLISGIKGLDGWPDEKIKRNIQFRVSMMETALQLCSNGNAIGFFPEFVIKSFNQSRKNELKLNELPAPKGAHNITRDIYIIKRKSHDESKMIKKIAKVIRTNCF